MALPDRFGLGGKLANRIGLRLGFFYRFWVGVGFG